jgi:protein O-GlcNAc transferase
MTEQSPKTLGEAVALYDKLRTEGKAVEARAYIENLCQNNPKHGRLRYLLGLDQYRAGDHAAALETLQQAQVLDPNFAPIHIDLGSALLVTGQTEAALAAFNRARELDATLTQAHNNAAMIYLQNGQWQEGEAALRQTLELDPDNAIAHANLGTALLKQRHYDEAEPHLQRAITLQPQLAEVHNNLGNLYQERADYELALQSFQKAHEVNPQWATPLGNMGGTLRQLGRWHEAEKIVRQGLEVEPDNANALSCLAWILLDMNRHMEAVEVFRQVTEADPDHLEAQRSLMGAESCLALKTPQEFLAQTEQYVSKRYASVQSLALPREHFAASAQRPLKRLGLVSGDIGQHPVGYFTSGLLRHIKPMLEKEGIELFIFSTRAPRFYDETTTYFQKLEYHWRDLHGLSNPEAIEVIRAEQIDILLDLSGHTLGDQLSAFAARCAPVQGSWLGYYASTGIANMDYLLGDNIVAPLVAASEEPSVYTEQVARFPNAYGCFDPPQDSPAVSASPAQENGFITFGNFNNLIKMTDAMLELWCELLTELPNSKLMLKTRQLTEPEIRESLLPKFETHGIAADRLLLEPGGTRMELLATYNRVDIALDTFPYPGGTTTAEALWMGVPVVTLSGDRFLSRVGHSILAHAGFEDLVTYSMAEYKTKVIELAADVEALSQRRQEMRPQFEQSPGCDNELFAVDFLNLMQDMWTDWQQTGQETGQQTAG